MKEGWICRDYRVGDEYRILTLFQEVFGKEMSLAFWKWRFKENPFGEGIVKLLFDDDKLIGHYAVTPVNTQVEGRLVRAVFSLTTMTHPDYAGQGIFTYLAEVTYKLSDEKGYHFVYGFPNKNSYHAFTRKLGWCDSGEMTSLEKSLRTDTRTNLVTKGIKKIECFGDSLNALWDKVKQDYAIIVPRSKEFLNWRFTENPDTEYIKCLILDGDDVLGYLVLKIYQTGDMMKGHIVDLLSVPEADVVRSLLKWSQSYFLEKSTHDISCWVPEKSLYANVLREEGFHRQGTETYFGTRVFKEAGVLSKSVEQFANWHLTMADSDVF
ncbi:MAG: GNAT family N-acetyltransferase [Dehalococcoidales bacterium]